MNIVNHKKTILIIIAVLIAFFVYWFVFVSKKEATGSTGNQSNLKSQINVSDTPYDKEFVTSLLGLNSVKLNVSIFESKAYKALNYPEVPFVINYSKESGRDNPFLPIGIDSSASITNAQTQNKTVTATTSIPTPVPTTLKTPVVSPTPPTTPKAPSAPTLTPTPTPKRF